MLKTRTEIGSASLPVSRATNMPRPGAGFIAGPGGIRRPSQAYRQDVLPAIVNYLGHQYPAPTRPVPRYFPAPPALDSLPYGPAQASHSVSGQVAAYQVGHARPARFASRSIETLRSHRSYGSLHSRGSFNDLSRPLSPVSYPKALKHLGLRTVSPNLRVPPQRTARLVGPPTSPTSPGSASSHAMQSFESYEKFSFGSPGSVASSVPVQYDIDRTPHSSASPQSVHDRNDAVSRLGQETRLVPDADAPRRVAPAFYDYTEAFAAEEPPMPNHVYMSRLPLRVKTPNRLELALVENAKHRQAQVDAQARSTFIECGPTAVTTLDNHPTSGVMPNYSFDVEPLPMDYSGPCRGYGYRKRALVVVNPSHQHSTIEGLQDLQSANANEKSAFSYTSSEASDSVSEVDTPPMEIQRHDPSPSCSREAVAQGEAPKFRLRGRQSRVRLASSLDFNPWNSDERRVRQSDCPDTLGGTRLGDSEFFERHSYPPKFKLKLSRTSASSLNSDRIKNPSPSRVAPLLFFPNTTGFLGIQRDDSPASTAQKFDLGGVPGLQDHQVGTGTGVWEADRWGSNRLCRDAESVASGLDPQLRELYPTEWMNSFLDSTVDVRPNLTLPRPPSRAQNPAPQRLCNLENLAGSNEAMQQSSSGAELTKKSAADSPTNLAFAIKRVRVRSILHKFRRWAQQGKKHAIRAKRRLMRGRGPGSLCGNTETSTAA